MAECVGISQLSVGSLLSSSSFPPASPAAAKDIDIELRNNSCRCAYCGHHMVCHFLSSFATSTLKRYFLLGTWHRFMIRLIDPISRLITSDPSPPSLTMLKSSRDIKYTEEDDKPLMTGSPVCVLDNSIYISNVSIHNLRPRRDDLAQPWYVQFLCLDHR